MAQRVLVFEKDTNFVRKLEEGFGQGGVEVEVARDPDASLARARQGEVKLVLLSVDAMGAPGEAFLVCKRFKSDDELARIPLVIMGGRQHAESFESHKKLKKRRADEYVELPISFEDLMAKVGPLAGLANGKHMHARKESSESVGVDDDIDAFAESAFGELLREEDGEQRAVESVQPSGELEQLRADIERLARSSKEAAERADSAERRAHEAEARVQEAVKRAETAEKRSKLPPAPGVAGPGGGMSSRDYLELREQLNRKDKELLALRSEITQRDRQLLDESDRSLQLERVQAELHENLLSTQRQLDDAQTKIRAYEVDREAVNKRLEELRGRLSRAEEKSKRLEDEAEATRAAHENELSELKAAHEQALAERERAAAAELQRVREEHAAAQNELETRSTKELEAARAAHENELSSLRATHEAEVEDKRRAADSALASALGAAAAERARALEALSAERAQELDRRLSDAERARVAALAGLEKELDAKFAGERRDLEERHAREVGILAQRLSEAESRGIVLSERIEELEQSKQDLETSLNARIRAVETDLSRRTEERDTAQNELSAMRASIESLERTGAQLSERLSALEEELGRANERIDQQSAKIALDKELLDRVRRALGIGIGLLEQQKHNVV